LATARHFIYRQLISWSNTEIGERESNIITGKII